MKLTDYVIVWTDTVPGSTRLAETAQARGGELLAAGPVHDVSERDSRDTPAGLVIARFAGSDNAKSWFATVGELLDGTALLVAGAGDDPVWWPPEKEAGRPVWSRRGDLPRNRLGLFVCVWAHVTDRDQFIDYSQHYRWTVEEAGGLVLVPGARPSQVVLRGAGPDAIALMGWPAEERPRRAWYDGQLYRPYRDQRHRSSRTTNVSVLGAVIESRDFASSG